ncbi:hypothetical protein D6C79_08054 [Aureobasidium pullulans]|nr:hypothetical protein D6C79_08054 [Aureobasidium pullulans]
MGCRAHPVQESAPLWDKQAGGRRIALQQYNHIFSTAGCWFEHGPKRTNRLNTKLGQYPDGSGPDHGVPVHALHLQGNRRPLPSIQAQRHVFVTSKVGGHHLLSQWDTIDSIDLGIKGSHAAMKASLKDFYMTDTYSESECSVQFYADLYLLATHLGREDIAPFYLDRFSALLSKEPFTYDYIACLETYCGPVYSRYSESTLSEVVFQQVLHRVRSLRESRDYPPSYFARALQCGTVFNIRFAARFASEVFSSLVMEVQRT